MEYEKIKQIMDEMSNSKLTSMEIEFKDGMKISMKKDNTNNQICTPINSIETEGVEDSSKIITSPMVGTFYSKPSPEEDDYVTINKNINKGDTVCIIEAMKLMNEIESEYSGKIVEIYVKNGQTVEYGSKLFRIE
ncbi:MAG: acetyl-CoA carboxylase biotin carboxyl carrier protein [Mollicutes bacterium]|nr:acetyl-CoA carboxylase biotin carboxyl carrier protein [Mollicutes bacterium]